jgi:hypothetical protein
MRGRLKGWLGLGLAARSGRDATRCTGMACVRRACSRRGHHAQLMRAIAPWRACRRLAGGKVLPMNSRGRREGVGQGGQGSSSPKRRRDGEAVEDASGGG